MHGIKVFWYLSMFLQVIATLGSPVIQYCITEDSKLPEEGCFVNISSSTFSFGNNIQRNVVESPYISYYPGQTQPDAIHLRCLASYPIRWLAQKKLVGPVRYVSSKRSNRFHHDLLSNETNEYLEQISITLPIDRYFDWNNGAQSGRIVRCESFSNHNLAADLFIDSAPDYRPSGDFFLVEDNCEDLNCTFTLPCFAKSTLVPFVTVWTNEYLVVLPSRNSSEEDATLRISMNSRNYDPRVGMRVSQPPDFRSVYKCSFSGRDSVTLIPLSSRRKINASLYISTSTKNEIQDVIFCRIGNFEKIHPSIRIAERGCNNVTQCNLEHRPFLPNVFGEHNHSAAKTWSSNGLALINRQGYVECSGILESPKESNGPNPLDFVSEIDYFFTGLDGRKYLGSQPFPMRSVIDFTRNQELYKENVSYAFECKISTFVLLKNIQFVVEFANQENPQETWHIRAEELPPNCFTITRPFKTNDQTGIASMTIKLSLASDMTAVACYAPWINSTHWAKAVVMLGLKSLDAEDAIYYDDNKGNQVSIGAIISGLAAVAVFAAVLTALRIVRRKHRIKVKVPQEIEFHDFESIGMEGLGLEENFMIPSESLTITGTLLGEGQYGIVREGFYRGQCVAVKSCKPNADRDYFHAFLKELSVMAYLGEHENVVRFLGAVVDNVQRGECFVVIELSPIGNLNRSLRTSAKSMDESQDLDLSKNNIEGLKLNQSVLLGICKQMAAGMEYLSQKKVIHGDLALRNVLVFDGNVVKITDFGLSRQLYNYTKYVKTKQVPLPWRWMSPETLRYMEFSVESDVWSFGVTVWEVFSLAQIPFSGQTYSPDFIDEIESGYRMKKPDLAPPDVYTLMTACWARKPEERPTFYTCMKFFQSLESTSLAGESRLNRIMEEHV